MKDILITISLHILSSGIEFPGKWRIKQWLHRNERDLVRRPPRIVRIDSATSFFVDPRFNLDAYISGFTGTPPVETIIRECVRKGDNVLDIGANAGWTAVLCSDLIGPEGKVFAFEPMPNVFQTLVLNQKHARNHNITLFQVAVSDAVGTADLYLPSDNETALASMQPKDGEHPGNVFRAEMTTIDSMLDSLPKISFVKIDVEGAELKALRGMAALLERDRPYLAIELTDQWLKNFGDSGDDLLDFVRSRGYRVEQVSDRKHLPIDRAPVDQVDIVCYPS